MGLKIPIWWYKKRPNMWKTDSCRSEWHPQNSHQYISNRSATIGPITTIKYDLETTQK